MEFLFGTPSLLVVENCNLLIAFNGYNRVTSSEETQLFRWNGEQLELTQTLPGLLSEIFFSTSPLVVTTNTIERDDVNQVCTSYRSRYAWDGTQFEIQNLSKDIVSADYCAP